MTNSWSMERIIKTYFILLLTLKSFETVPEHWK